MEELPETGPAFAPRGEGLETERMRGMIAQRLFDVPATPPRIGRFAVIDTIGRGAMGTVLAAWDPQLDRRVAVKVLHGRPEDVDRGRLVEEAKALARLNHPNVVTVYEAGLSDGRVYMAMEFVEGGTLRDACSAIPLSRRGRDRRVHTMFVEAARGLQAAHRVGLVHRDVKPTNMLIDRDGRLRLADFGLARAEIAMTVDGAPMPEPASTTEEHTPGTGHREQTGWVGTPAYMAPEQFDGRADERSDQFNLCASFWEIVYGRPPYAGASISETCGNIIEGKIQPPHSESSVPAWLRRILVRGIAVAPGQRFQSVAALLRELERSMSGTRRRRWVAGALVVGIGATAGVYATRPAAEDVTARCTAEADSRAPSLDDGARDRLESAFSATQLAAARSAWMKVDLQLQEWHEAWRQADISACRAEASADDTRARAAAHQRDCLVRAAIAFTSLTEALEQADASTVQRASLAVVALPSPERCTVEGVERVLEDASPRLAAAAAELARAGTDRSLRRVDTARDRLERLLEGLGQDDAALRAYVHQELATLAHLRGDYDDVLAQTRAALADAELSGDVEAQLHAWRVMGLAHARKAEPQATELVLARMDSLSRRADVSLPTRARIEWGAAAILVALKRYAEALPRFQRALSTYEREIRSPLQIASLRCDYSEVLFVEEHIDEAIEQVRACRTAEIDGFGESHPFVAVASLQLSQYLQWAGDAEAAIEAADTARSILDANPWFSRQHRASAYKLRGDALQRLGRHEEALKDFETALTLAIEQQGPDGVDTALVRSDMALSYVQLGRGAEARAALEAAVASASKNPAIMGSARGTPRLNLALALADAGEHDAALEHLGHARAILDDARPASSSLSPSYWVTVAQVYRLCGRLSEAREALDRALASIETARVDAARRGRVVAEDARLHAALGRTEAAAARIARARALLREAGEAAKTDLAELEAWADDRSPSP